MRFKVKVGFHIQKGRRYGPGEVVISENELDKKFPGKFSNVGSDISAPEPAPEPALEGVPAPAPNKPGRSGASKSNARHEASPPGTFAEG